MNMFNRICQVAMLDRNGFVLSGAVGHISMAVNPFIYALRYEVFRRYLKQMLNRSSVTSTSGNTA